MSPAHFDLLVIGGGPAGSSAALTAAAFGKRVALVELEAHVGGAGINTGTIPSKTLRENALVVAGARARALACIDMRIKPQLTLAAVTGQVESVEAGIRHEWDARLRQCDVAVHHGRATFVDAHTAEVATAAGPVQLSADVIVIATGSSPVRPEGFDFAHRRVHDSNEILEITELPVSLAVVGAG